MAFVHPSSAALKLQEQLTEMIFKNVQSLVAHDMDSRQVAREKDIIRNSLRGKSFEQMEAERLRTNSNLKAAHKEKQTISSATKSPFMRKGSAEKISD